METWKPILGYEGRYEISNLGQVRNMKHNIIRTRPSRTGYELVTLHKDGVRTTESMHRVVAIHFIDNPENKTQVNHIDENKYNNCVDNLEWMTAKENINHGTAIERRSKPITNGIKIYMSATEAAKELGIHRNMIYRVLQGKRERTAGYHWTYI